MEIHMNTKTSTSPAKAAFKSLTDSAYQQAGANQTIEDVAKFAIEKIAGFPVDVPTEAKDSLYEGYRMRFAQNNAPVVYAVISDHYVLATPEHMAAKNVEKIEISVAYAFSYSSQEFGKLKNTQPALHALVSAMREKCSSYCSNRLADLKRKAKELLAEGKPRERTANKNFSEFVEDWIKDAALTRLISAKARGDATADSERYNKAAAAFLSVWAK
jgi:hypothetical protein